MSGVRPSAEFEYQPPAGGWDHATACERYNLARRATKYGGWDPERFECICNLSPEEMKAKEWQQRLRDKLLSTTTKGELWD